MPFHIERCELALPEWWQPEPFLSFHGRDHSGCAELATSAGLQKALILQGQCALIQFDFVNRGVRLALQAQVPCLPDADWLASTASHMLGLNQGAGDFHAEHHQHPAIGALLANQPPLYLPQTATPFEAASWAITGQQISLAAALTLRRRLIQACDLSSAWNLLCYPDAAKLEALGIKKLRSIGYSQNKADALLALSQCYLEDKLPSRALGPHERADPVIECLLGIRGVGLWTAHYTLLRGYGYMDADLHDDVGVQRGLQKLLSSETRPGALYTREWLAPFAPKRGLAAAYLWSRA